MRYRRALLLLEHPSQAAVAMQTLHRVAPGLDYLLVLVRAPLSWRSRDELPSLDPVREQAEGLASQVTVELETGLGGEVLGALCVAEELDLLAFSERSYRNASAASEARKRHPVAALWADVPSRSGALVEVGCVAIGQRSRAAIGVFLRDHADPSMNVSMFSPTTPASQSLASYLEVSGIASPVSVSSPAQATSIRSWLEQWTTHRPPDLLVFSRLPTAALLGATWPSPVLLVPPPPSTLLVRRDLDVADLIDDGESTRVYVGLTATVGAATPLPDQKLVFVSGGRTIAEVESQEGQLTLPAALPVEALGIYRAEGAVADPVLSIEHRLLVIRPGKKPLVLFDAELDDAALGALAKRADETLAVRLRPTRSCAAIRDRLHAAGLPRQVIDARAVLDEGQALDVSEPHDAVRLVRVAKRLQRAGFPVHALVYRGLTPPDAPGLVALPAGDLDADPERLQTSEDASASIEGNRLTLELDNRQARQWLLDAIATSRSSVHFQVYMAADDALGQQVAQALVDAGARGVTVRVLIDSLHGFHGSFGATNPLLQRLLDQPGVEVRSLHPITELPTIADLKQRDHRKLVVVDGEVALMGGRNLGAEYYTAFDEVPLSPSMSWRDVPWLDSGARVEGPVVGALASAFRDAWVEAGGDPFETMTPAVCGDSTARVVVHRGLRDARTLETYLDFVDRARSHVYAVNGFPLVLELQLALLRALRRGVKVRLLTGHVTPTHEGQRFKGPGSTARVAATELVHSRLDPLVAAGAEVFTLALRDLPGWTPQLGLVQPHVHAKLMSVDGERCTVGSANLDITASYWESELLLVVEDLQVVGGLEAKLDALLAGSVRQEQSDPAWKATARRRAWMRHWPGLLSI